MHVYTNTGYKSCPYIYTILMRFRRSKALTFVVPYNAARVVLAGALIFIFMAAQNVLQGKSSVSEQRINSLHLQHAHGQYAQLMAPLVFPQLYPACDATPQMLTLAEEERSALHRSQDGESALLYEAFFKNYTEPGVFLEMGALDGEKFSNTYFFEKALGWKGILVEANPENAAEFRRKNDRGLSAFFPVAICQIDDLGHPGKVAITKGGSQVATAVDFAAPQFLETWKEWHGGETVDVPCLPLQLIIEATGLLDIDLFSLDVEGAERIVLETVDLTTTNIRVLMVELDGLNKEKDDWVREYILQHGFTPVRIEYSNPLGNAFFLNPRYQEVKERRQLPPLQCAH